MARLIPSVGGRRLSSAAEKKLAERFKRELSDDDVLLHSVGFVRHATKRWAEADFVLICQAGVFCLEVKGGLVSQREGRWTFTNRFGHANDKFEGPFAQAGGAAGALYSWLGSNEVRRDDGSRFQVGYGVMIPDCVLDVHSPSVEPEVLLDQRDITRSLTSYVEQLGGYWQQRTDSAPLSAPEVERLVDAVRPDFDAISSRRFQLVGVEEELIRLTEEQLQILDALVENQRMIVRGAAGTGKTLLALREAKRLAEHGSVLVVCFSRPLAATLRNAADGATIEVYAIDDLARHVIDECQSADRLPDAEESFLASIYRPELAAELASANSHLQFDAVVVDEAQDLLTDEYAALVDSVIKGGFGHGQWRLFMDPNQNIFGRANRSALDLVEEGHPTRMKLSANCRNTAQIVEASVLLSGADVAALADVHGPDVSISTEWKTEWLVRVEQEVRSLLGSGLSPADVVVLVPTAKMLRTVARALADLRVEYAFTIDTIANFKGFDSLVVVLAGVESLDAPDDRQALYVGTTRAKVYLSVILPAVAQPSYGDRVKTYVAQKVAELDAG